MKRLIVCACVLLLAGCGIYVVDRAGVRGLVVGAPPEPAVETVLVTPTYQFEPLPTMPIPDCDTLKWGNPLMPLRRHYFENDTVLRDYPDLDTLDHNP